MQYFVNIYNSMYLWRKIAKNLEKITFYVDKNTKMVYNKNYEI